LQLDDPVLLASTPDTAAVGLGQSGPVDLVAQDDDLKILDDPGLLEGTDQDHHSGERDH
jgi:hypothetical protein